MYNHYDTPAAPSASSDDHNDAQAAADYHVHDYVHDYVYDHGDHYDSDDIAVAAVGTPAAGQETAGEEAPCAATEEAPCQAQAPEEEARQDPGSAGPGLHQVAMKQLLRVGVLTAVAAFAVAQAAFPGAATAAPGCQWAAGPLPDPRVKEPVVGHLTIGSIGLSTPLFQGSIPDIESEASRSLNNGPAFYPQTMRWKNGLVNSLPGQGGTVAMLGHRTTRTHPFCLVAAIRTGSFAMIKVHYGTYVYREIAKISLPGFDWSAFERPANYDPHPKTWNKGVKPEYLVIGACDPPHSAAKRLNVIFKLVSERGL